MLSIGEDLCDNSQIDLLSNAPDFDTTTDDILHTDDDYLCNLSGSVLVKLNASEEDVVSDDSEQEMDNEGQNSRYTAPSGREWFEVIAQGNSGRAAARNIFLP